MAKGPSRVHEEIEHAGEELASTVQALGDNADVTARVNATADTLERLQDKTRGLTSHLREFMPEDASHAVTTAVDKLSEQQTLLWAGVAFIAGLLIGRRLGASS